MRLTVATLFGVAGLFATSLCGCRTASTTPTTPTELDTGYRYQQYGSFTEWDSDGDRKLSLIEVRRGISAGGLFSAWDTDSNHRLSRKEFEFALFSAWDTDGDGGLDIGELTAGAVAWLPKRATTSIQFGIWDRDRDGLVSRDEFSRGIEMLELWPSWDRNHDGEIDRSEYAAALVESWDTDSDGLIDLYEYRWAG